MPDRRRPAARRGGPSSPYALPEGPLTIATGTVELRRDRHDPAGVTVVVNGVPSSHLDLADPTRLDFEYMQQMAAVVGALAAGPLDVVHLGAAACTFPRWLDAVRPGSRQIAVDLDPVLLELVRTWFALPRSPALRLRAADARASLAAMPDASADVVVRDVFAGDVTPAHLCTRGFLEEVARVLRPGGTYLANCADRPPLALARAEVATARAVLADVALTAEPAQLKNRRYGNLVVVGVRSGQAAPDRDLDLGGAALARALRSLPVPVRLLHGADLDRFAAGATVLDDEQPPGGPPPAA